MSRVEDRDLGLRQIMNDVADLKGGVRVGWFSDEHPSGFGMAELAATHEFGAGATPARSPLGTTFDARADDLQQMIEAGVGRLIDGDASAAQTLAQIGAAHVGQVQEQIAAGLEPANAPATIEQKGSSKPLIDTGALRQGLTWEASDGLS